MVAVTAPPEFVHAAHVVALTSVQMAEEELLPLEQLGMSWRPLLHGDGDSGMPMELAGRLHYLHCSLRWSEIRRMEEAKRARYEYVLPYLRREETAAAAAQEERGVRRVSFAFRPLSSSPSVGARTIELIFDKVARPPIRPPIRPPARPPAPSLGSWGDILRAGCLCVTPIRTRETDSTPLWTR